MATPTAPTLRASASFMPSPTIAGRDFLQHVVHLLRRKRFRSHFGQANMIRDLACHTGAVARDQKLAS